MTDGPLNTAGLLDELASLARQGPIRAVGFSSSSVGKTLQSSLGIQHSTTTRNSKYGYTITATTQSVKLAGRTNLFACVPDWNGSHISSSTELAAMVGRPNEERGYSSSLFCTVNALQANSFGLMLHANVEKTNLCEVRVSDDYQVPILQWNMDKIYGKLKKLGHSAIVSADCIRTKSGKTSFQFRKLELLGAPDQTMFLQLIDEGAITIDHLISRKHGDRSAREKGPLFKIRGDARDQLYSSVERFDLLVI